jgi:hypothetical protein
MRGTWGTPCQWLVSSARQRRRVVAEHRFAHDLDGWKSLAQKNAVEFFKLKGSALFLPHVFAQLHDLKLAERVAEVGPNRLDPLLKLPQVARNIFHDSSS